MRKIEVLFLFIIYIFINYLFLYKYGIRQNYIDEIILIIFYLFLIILFLYLLNKIQLRKSTLKFIFFTSTILFFLFTIFINNYIDGNSVNVDRWPAMEASISALLNNQYPYAAIDHLNGRSSNLPGLLIIGLPFYLIGNIGFLQSFTFLLFSFTIYKSIHNFKAKILALFLLVFSISFLWEVYVKSDLMSNFIIILSFVSLWYLKYKNTNLENPGLLAGISSVLLLTRLISIIPLTLLIFKPFVSASFKKKLKFIFIATLTILVLVFIILYNCPSLEVFKNNNPIALQNRQLPFYISLIVIIIPFFYSKKINSLDLLIKFSLVFLFIPVFLSFFISIFKYGIFEIIKNSAFDISYFNIIMPFLIYYIAIKYDNYIGANSKLG